MADGALFCREVAKDKNLDIMHERFVPLGVVVTDLESLNDATTIFEGAGFPKISSDDSVMHWRWVHATERKLINKLVQRKKSMKDSIGPAAVLEYHRLVNDGIFFQPTIRGRILALYEAYQSHPRLALSCACEIDGKAFDPDVPFGTQSASLRAAMLTGEQPLLQMAFYVRDGLGSRS